MAAEADRDELEAERMRGGCPKRRLRLTLLPQQRHIESHSGHLRENEESRSDVLQRQRDDERATPRRGANRGQYPHKQNKIHKGARCRKSSLIGVGREQANDRRAQYESVSSRGLGPVSDHLC